MILSFEGSFEAELLNVSRTRGEAILDAIERFRLSPSDRLLQFHPIRNLTNWYTIRSRHDDWIVLRQDGPDEYTAVEIGPYSRIYDKWRR